MIVRLVHAVTLLLVAELGIIAIGSANLQTTLLYNSKHTSLGTYNSIAVTTTGYLGSAIVFSLSVSIKIRSPDSERISR